MVEILPMGDFSGEKTQCTASGGEVNWLGERASVRHPATFLSVI
jgi:hypothetical protein